MGRRNINNSGGSRRMVEMGRPLDRPQNIIFVVTRLFSYWKKYWWMLFLIVFASLLEIGCSLLAPYLIGKAIDDCISGETVDLDSLTYILGSLITVYVGGAFFNWFQEFGIIKVSLKIVQEIRLQMVDKLHSLNLHYYDTHQRGDIMSRFTNDVELIKDGFGDTVVQLFTSLFSLLGIIIVMWMLSPLLMLITCTSIPLVILLSRFVMKRTRRYFAEQQAVLGELNSLIEENISGLKIVRAFGQEAEQIKKFTELNLKMQKLGTKAQISSGILMPLMRVLDNFSYILVVVAGGILAFKGFITIGIIQSFLLYTRHFLRPINQLATQFNSVQSAIAGAERVFKLLDENSEIEETKETKKLGQIQGKVIFDNVSFGYEPGLLILKNISFAVNPGEVVAIVGATGVGKTTIINLLMRFYDVSSGSIRIDGSDIRDVSLSSLRQSLGIVLQEPFLFSESVSYNIAYGNPKAKNDKIESASFAANAHSFILRLSSCFHTVLSEQEADISHGQKQLITIARAILINPRILILDEATSNIDTRMEILIQKAIMNLIKGRTCFIIAHRLSTIKNADKILVLENGEIVESGNHMELLSKKGVYFRIYKSQFFV